MVWVPESTKDYLIRALAEFTVEHDRRFDLLSRQTEHQLRHMEIRIMAALDDLKSAITDMGTEVTAAVTEIETLLTKITAPGTSDADVATAVQSIRDITSSLKTEVDKATSSVT